MINKTEVFGAVRNDKQYHSLTEFITPHDNTIMMLCEVLFQAPDPVAKCQDYIHYRAKYRAEVGEFFQYPMETLMQRQADCDDSAIALCTLLRNMASEDEVFVCVGNHNGKGHAWVVYKNKLLESTRESAFEPDVSEYSAQLMFNDKNIYLAMPNQFGYYFVQR